MASLSKDGTGWRILFVCPATKKRRTIRTGKCGKKDAVTTLNMIERLISARVLGTPFDQQTGKWLGSIDGKLRERLAKVGLCEAAQSSSLGEFLDGYFDQRRRRGDLEGSTLLVWGHVRRNLFDFFGRDKDMRKITSFDADEWCAWLVEDQELAENTICKRVQVAKSLFKVAQKRKLTVENPFKDLDGTVKPSSERQYFIPRETVTALLNQCNSIEYRHIGGYFNYRTDRAQNIAGSKVMKIQRTVKNISSFPVNNMSRLTFAKQNPEILTHKSFF